MICRAALSGTETAGAKRRRPALVIELVEGGESV